MEAARRSDGKPQSIPDVKKKTLRDAMFWERRVRSTVSTDELVLRFTQGDGYKHGVVKHRRRNTRHYDYRAPRTPHQHGRSRSGSCLRCLVRETHMHVSQQIHGPLLEEFTFRANHREMQNAMFDLLIAAV